jgi:branched-chain amino acid transport system ATP-binding protein
MLLVEQNAAMALELADRGCVIETGRVVLAGTAAELKGDDAVRRSYLGY